ncbi:MAG: ATP-binding protein, partial [Chloroflexota bacterium]
MGLVIGHDLSAPPTPFIGRQADLAELSSLLSTPACRLLTLVGPGGIGKTRLALQAAARLRDARAAASGRGFGHGVYVVALQALRSPDLLLPALADALALPPVGSGDPLAQLLNYLRDKAVLLVLDNFEHLMHGAALLAGILAAAPQLKLLVTSREALNVQEEWLYPIQGLPFPDSELAADLEDYSAVRLFAERARRVRWDFSLDAERAGVVRVCRLVEGMPLALELAAAWTKTLPCAEIATEIESSIDFLATRLRDVPERHRSMQAVFEQSWARLDGGERAVLRRLSVFRGGFRREAAEQVAGASIPTLSLLVDKSLLRLEVDGRYQIHELLRQYAEERLRCAADEAAQVHDRHCAHFAALLQARLGDILGSHQQEAVAEIKT